MSAEDRHWAITAPMYCRPCSQAEDMEPAYYDFDKVDDPVEAVKRGPGSKVYERLEKHRSKRFGFEMRKRAQAALEALLPSLTGFELEVWSMVCEGMSERAIGKALGLSQTGIYNRVIRPLRLKCGLPVRRSCAEYVRTWRKSTQAKVSDQST